MNLSEINKVLEFIKHSEQLKNTLRSSNTSNGRNESTAEHTWRLCLMVLLFENHYPKLDILKLLKICIIHDLGEAISGDIPAIKQVEGVDKGIQERKDLQQLISPLPPSLKNKILQLWDEYEQAASKEAIIAKAFDKLETLLQHTQGKNDSDFDYDFNLSYGKKYTDQNEITSKLRTLIDIETKALADSQKTNKYLNQI